MTPEQLSDLIGRTLTAAITALGGDPAVVPANVTVERPKNRDHGDYATNVALQTAKRAGLQPRALAAELARRLGEDAASGVASAEVAGPGFVNIRLAAASQGQLAAAIVAAGASYGTSTTLAGSRINVEFISANPTGPLHLGHTRWAALGDAIARVLIAAGAEVTREYYINDRGVQMQHFGNSIMAAAHGRPTPADGYHGEYITTLAQRILADAPEILDLPEAEQAEQFRERGYELQLAAQRDSLSDFRTNFDVWFSERYLHTSGAVESGMATLRAQGHLYDSDGALWMRTTDFGDDKDRVLVKSDGSYTYFASDAAYYVNKRDRGFTRCIYLLGADHHGYVGRLRAMAACAGDDPSQTLEVLIGQLVKILQGGVEVRLSKRAGKIVTLEDFVELAGIDAVRYSLCRYPADSPLTLDIADITKQDASNPVFYVQYAHARLASVLRSAADLGIDRGELDPSLLSHEKESLLLGALGEFPRVVATAAELREPHRIARYLEATASTFHKFYDECRVLPRGDEPVTDVHRARLWLVDATRIVIANGLDLMGVAAPERM